MRLPNFRIRTLMLAVGVVALLIWAAIMGPRSSDYAKRARDYDVQERAWREITDQGDFPREFCAECAAYFAQLAAKYRQAMWRPWRPVAPDPHAPGYDQMIEQQRRAKGSVP